MAYQIIYGPTQSKSTPAKPQRKWIIWLCCATVLGTLLIPTVRKKAQSFLFPGDRAKNIAAWETMIADIHDGETFSDAFSAFYDTILENADISE